MESDVCQQQPCPDIMGIDLAQISWCKHVQIHGRLCHCAYEWVAMLAGYGLETLSLNTSSVIKRFVSWESQTRPFPWDKHQMGDFPLPCLTT